MIFSIFAGNMKYILVKNWFLFLRTFAIIEMKKKSVEHWIQCCQIRDFFNSDCTHYFRNEKHDFLNRYNSKSKITIL